MTDSVECNMSRILLTIPVWNEEEIITESITRLHFACVKALQGHDWHIEIADNGSTDKTSAQVLNLVSLGNISLRTCVDRGKGLAIRASWLAGRENYDVFVFMDADLSTDLATLLDLIMPIASTQVDVMCGSRMLEKSLVHRSIFRKFISFVYSTVQRIVLKLPVRDSQCGYKAVSSRVVTEVVSKLQEYGYLFDTELLAIAQKRGYTIREFPVEWRESIRRSRVRPIIDGIAFLFGVLAMRQRIQRMQNTQNGQDIQVPASHYIRPGYLFPERWASYWHQIDAVRCVKPQQVLEVGVGNGIVAHAIEKIGITVDTLDIDPELHPTILGSVMQIPCADQSYDVVLCAEVLEHLPWGDFSKALSELRRVTKKHVIMTLPHAGYVFSLLGKIPFFSWKSFGFKIPHFWKRHVFNGQHYWETGKKGYSRACIVSEIQKAGFRIIDARIYPDDPAHFCVMCEKI